LRLRSADICLGEKNAGYLHPYISVPCIAASRLRGVAGVALAVGLRRIANAGRSAVFVRAATYRRQSGSRPSSGINIARQPPVWHTVRRCSWCAYPTVDRRVSNPKAAHLAVGHLAPLCRTCFAGHACGELRHKRVIVRKRTEGLAAAFSNSIKVLKSPASRYIIIII